MDVIIFDEDLDVERTIAGGTEIDVEHFVHDSGQLEHPQNERTALLWALSHPDGEWLATVTGNGKTTVWRAADGERVANREQAVRAGGELLWHPDGRRLVAPCEDGALRYWDAASGRLLGALYARDGDWLAVTPEGTFAAGGEGARWLQYRVGEQLFPADRFRERFEDPERVRAALAGR